MGHEGGGRQGDPNNGRREPNYRAGLLGDQLIFCQPEGLLGLFQLGNVFDNRDKSFELALVISVRCST